MRLYTAICRGARLKKTTWSRFVGSWSRMRDLLRRRRMGLRRAESSRWAASFCRQHSKILFREVHCITKALEMHMPQQETYEETRWWYLGTD